MSHAKYVRVRVWYEKFLKLSSETLSSKLDVPDHHHIVSSTNYTQEAINSKISEMGWITI